MNNRFNGQVALVTGGAGPIGRGIARRLCAEGATVLLLDTNREDLNEALAEVKEKGSADVLLADVSDETAAQAAVDEVVARWGKLDILVHCTSIEGPAGTGIIEYE